MLAERPGDFQVFFDAFMVVAFRAEVMDGTVSVVCSSEKLTGNNQRKPASAKTGVLCSIIQGHSMKPRHLLKTSLPACDLRTNRVARSVGQPAASTEVSAAPSVRLLRRYCKPSGQSELALRARL